MEKAGPGNSQHFHLLSFLASRILSVCNSKFLLEAEDIFWSLSVIKYLIEKGNTCSNHMAVVHWFCVAKLLVIHSCLIWCRRGNL